MQELEDFKKKISDKHTGTFLFDESDKIQFTTSYVPAIQGTIVERPGKNNKKTKEEK
jgi:hypothetical protein